METIKTTFDRLGVCVIIPTYNNAHALENVLNGVLSYTDHVIVVNDGSTDRTAEILNSFGQVKVESYAVNKGKGYALRHGLFKAYESGYHYAITIDSDGQHFPEDLPKFLEKIEAHPGSLIMGARNMEQAGVPGKSSFGNKFSNFWFKFETGLSLSDTQTGYRLYPLKSLANKKFFTRKFEFEIEVLVRSAWSGISIHEVPVKVYYADKSERVSHFRPFRDFTRISILNTVLVTITLLYIKPRDLYRKFRTGELRAYLRQMLWQKEEPVSKKAFAIALGVFMGIVPIWGFQMLAALALAFFFKLNKALVILASNISFGPMVPIILFLSHEAGKPFMGDQAISLSFDQPITFELVEKSLLQYVIGAFALATAAGLFSGLLTFTLLKIFRR